MNTSTDFQTEFYKLPRVESLLSIQKNNPHGSVEHRRSFNEIKQLMCSFIGAQKTNEIMGSYD